MAAECGIEPSVPRIARAQKQCTSSHAQAALAQGCLLPLVDRMVQELNDRLPCRNDLFLGQRFIISMLSVVPKRSSNVYDSSF